MKVGAEKPHPRLLVRLGLAEADDFVTHLELTARLQDFDALETLQDVALCCDGALTFERTMLGHVKRCGFGKGRALYERSMG